MTRPLRIDWPRIKEVYETDEHVLCLMTKRASSVLLSMMHMLEWRATFDVDGYDYEDWDELQAILSEADYEIGAAMPLSQIVELIDEVEDLLRAINSHAQCCGAPGDPTDGSGYTDSVTDGVGNVPQNIIDAGYASGVSDWDGFDDYKCMIAHLTVDHMEELLRQFLPHFDSTGLIIGGIGTVAALLGTILATGGLIIVFQILAAVAGAATIWSGLTLLTAAGVEALADDVASNHDELVCAIYAADGSDAAVIALKDKIDELWTDTEALVLKNLNIGPTIKALYSGRYQQQDVAAQLAAKGYDLDDFVCSCVDAGQYNYTWTFNGSQREGWTAWTMDAVNGNPTPCLNQAYNNNTGANISVNSIRSYGAGLGTVVGEWVDLKKIIFQYKSTDHASAPGLRLRIWQGDHTSTALDETFAQSRTQWTQIERTFSPPIRCNASFNMVEYNSNGGTGNYVFIDNIYLEFDANQL